MINICSSNVAWMSLWFTPAEKWNCFCKELKDTTAGPLGFAWWICLFGKVSGSQAAHEAGFVSLSRQILVNPLQSLNSSLHCMEVRLKRIAENFLVQFLLQLNGIRKVFFSVYTGPEHLLNNFLSFPVLQAGLEKSVFLFLVPL